MERLFFLFLVQQSPLVEVGSSLPEKSWLLQCAASSQGDPVLSLGHCLSPRVPRAVINRAVPWPQPESMWDRPESAIAPPKCPSARQLCMSVFHLVGILRFSQGAAEPALPALLGDAWHPVGWPCPSMCALENGNGCDFGFPYGPPLLRTPQDTPQPVASVTGICDAGMLEWDSMCLLRGWCCLGLLQTPRVLPCPPHR